MNSKLSPIGLLSTLLFASTCASGGATTIPEARPEAHLDGTGGEEILPRRTCASSGRLAAPADGMIADFSGTDPGSGAPGRIATLLPPAPKQASALTHEASGGNLTIGVNAVPGAKPQVLVTTLLFDSCLDASGFAGVQFNLSGSLSGCALNYASVDVEHQYYRAGGPYPPQKRLSPADLTPQPQTIKAPFLKPDDPGNPAVPTDPSKLLFVQWLVMVPVGSHDGSPVPPCTGSITVDDVKLYR